MRDHGSDSTTTARIIAAAFEVSNGLGVGFLEKVYERALIVELRAQELAVRSQVPAAVHYRGETVGAYVADLVVEERVVVEVKAMAGIDPIFVAQVLNYLRALRLRTGLILNFGTPRVGIKRVSL